MKHYLYRVHKDVKHMCNTNKFLIYIEYIRMLNTCVTQTYLYREYIRMLNTCVTQTIPYKEIYLIPANHYSGFQAGHFAGHHTAIKWQGNMAPHSYYLSCVVLELCGLNE